METDDLTADELTQMQAPEVPAEEPAEAPVETPAEETPAVPEETPAETPAPAEEQENPAMVPSFRLREVTEANTALKGEVSGMKETMSKMESAFDTIKDKLNPPAPPPAPTVPYDEDPTEHVRQQGVIDQQTNDAKITAMQENISEMDDNQKQQLAQLQFQNAVNGQVSDFKAATADYDEAAEFYRNKRELEFRAVGMTDEKQLGEWLDKEWAGLASAALQNGKNPAQAVYDLAKGYGYQANGTPATPQQSAGDKKLATIEKGQAASASLAAGSSASGEASLAQIAEMSDNDLMKVLDDPNGWEKLVKGAG